MTQISRIEFNQWVAEAYQYLYDWAYLRTHPLAELLFSDPQINRKQKAEELYQLLLKLLDELDSGHPPAFSRPWRRHRLLVLRYVDGKDIEAVSDELSVSKRQYYREHEAALEAVSDLLWDRYLTRVQPPSMLNTEATPGDAYQNLLRKETAYLEQTDRYCQVSEVIEGIRLLTQEMLNKRGLKLFITGPDEILSPVAVRYHVLRQIILGLLGYWIEMGGPGEITLAAEQNGAVVMLSIIYTSLGEMNLVIKNRDSLSSVQELAALNDLKLTIQTIRSAISGFTVAMPAAALKTILVVDDNNDILELMQRYLSANHYNVVSARSGREALQLAQQIRPYAISLDLMMPEQDGWDLLQILKNQADTRHIPVLVCSVLRQKELALSLGASAFLEKPITEQNLLAVMQLL
jgi:CheY-like chemotaxis protein